MDREKVARAICKPLGYILGFASDADPDRTFVTTVFERRTLRDISEELADAALSAMQGDGWREIESARRDGVGVIVVVPSGQVGEAYYYDGRDSDNGWWWAGENWSDHYASKIHPQPTRWQPLPAPPTAQPEQ